MEFFEFKDVKFNGNNPIQDWTYIDLDDYFIFYKLEDEKELRGFKFLSLEITARSIGKTILYPENGAQILYWGYAFFDGIRHLYLGDDQTDNAGYICYPKIKAHIKILQEIRLLEEKYCRDISS